MSEERNGAAHSMADIGAAKGQSIKRRVAIGDRTYTISGDGGYLDAMGDTFEPSTVHTLRALCNDGAQALDVGANIGLTALALSQYCEKVVGIEPVLRTFDYLRRNVDATPKISIFNHALGNDDIVLKMQGNHDFLAGSFIADSYEINDESHFVEEVRVKRLDDCFGSLGLDRVDFIKVDVEGFELEVFEGGRQVLNDFKPIALLEMNHWCLNVFRRISIPAFRERLLSVFPFLYAVDGSDFVDFGDERNAHRIFHAHLIEHRFANLVAGFDRDDLVSRLAALRGLDSLQPTSPPQTPSPQEEAMRAEIERLKGSIAELEKRLGESSSAIEAFKRSTSWKVTAPIRAVVRAFS